MFEGSCAHGICRGCSSTDGCILLRQGHKHQGGEHGVFCKRWFCLRDTRHFRHFRQFPGSEERSPLFLWAFRPRKKIFSPPPLPTDVSPGTLPAPAPRPRTPPPPSIFYLNRPPWPPPRTPFFPHPKKNIRNVHQALFLWVECKPTFSPFFCQKHLFSVGGKNTVFQKRRFSTTLKYVVW